MCKATAATTNDLLVVKQQQLQHLQTCASGWRRRPPPGLGPRAPPQPSGPRHLREQKGGTGTGWGSKGEGFDRVCQHKGSARFAGLVRVGGRNPEFLIPLNPFSDLREFLTGGLLPLPAYHVSVKLNAWCMVPLSCLCLIVFEAEDIDIHNGLGR